jgi:energy-coupling factor transporter ATP-binding protein EcfA2
MVNELLLSGLSVIPIGEDKRPKVLWKKYQDVKPLPGELHYDDRIGLICGKVSGNLEVIDVDSKNDKEGTLIDELNAKIEEFASDVLPKLVIQQTPSGGYHLIYRCSVIEGNQVFARDTDKSVLIETRGEGGYIACYPTPQYRLLYGTLKDIKEITPEERENLFTACRSLNRLFEEVKPKKAALLEGDTPWEDYNKKTDVSDLLIKHGWTWLKKQGDNDFWRRPGKTEGHSATWHEEKGLFYCFTSSSGLEPNKAYTPYALFTYFECNGDFSRSASLLRSQGFGQRTEEPKKITTNFYTKATDWKDRLIHNFENGKERGETTGIKALDDNLTIRKGFMYCMTGWPGSGKSELLTQLAVLQAINNKRKIAFYSPENYPVDEFVDAIIHCYTGKSPDKKYSQLTKHEYLKAIEWVDNFFYFLDWEDTPDANMVIEAFKYLNKSGVEMFCIDPFNSLISEGEDRNIAVSLKKNLTSFKRFSQQNRVMTFLIEHPKTPNVPEDYNNSPGARNLFGGTMWWNKVDVGITVHRPNREGINDDVEITTWKVKNQHYNGKPGTVRLKYEFKSRRYWSDIEREQVKSINFYEPPF